MNLDVIITGFDYNFVLTFILMTFIQNINGHIYKCNIIDGLSMLNNLIVKYLRSTLLNFLK